MCAEGALDASGFGGIVVRHGVAVGADEVYFFHPEPGLLECHRNGTGYSYAVLVYLPKVDALAYSRKTQDASVDGCPACAREFFILNSDHRRAFGQNKTGSPLIEGTTRFLRCSLPFRQNTDRVKKHQRVGR